MPNGTATKPKPASTSKTLKTRDLHGVEVLRVGKWNGNAFTRDMLEQMVTAYEETKDIFHAPVKLGHDDNQKLLQSDGYPAAGWVENLRLVGDRLVCDLMKVPEKVAALIEAGAYRTRSSEVWRKFAINGKEYPCVFTGLALLGADLPAVDSLDDITALYQSLQLSIEDGAEPIVYEMAAQQPEPEPKPTTEQRPAPGGMGGPDDASEMTFEMLLEHLVSLQQRAEALIKNKARAPMLRQLFRAYMDGLRQVGRLNQSQEGENDMTIDEKALRTALGLAEDGDILAAITELTAKAKTADEATAKVEKLTADLTDVSTRLLKIETGNVEKDAAQRVDLAIEKGKLLPVQRDTALVLARTNPEAFDKFVESNPKLVELGERGLGSGEVNLSQLEPTPAQVEAAKQMGVWSPEYRLKLIKSNAADRGITITDEQLVSISSGGAKK